MACDPALAATAGASPLHPTPAIAHFAGAGTPRSTAAHAAVVANDHTQPRRQVRRFESRHLNFASAAAVFGCQTSSGSSTCIRRLTHWAVLNSSFILRFSILVHVFLSKRLLGAADQRSDRSRIQIERRGH